MNKAESNETIMKQFEIMINTADEALSTDIRKGFVFYTGKSGSAIWRQRLFICCALDAPGVF